MASVRCRSVVLSSRPTFDGIRVHHGLRRRTDRLRDPFAGWFTAFDLLLYRQPDTAIARLLYDLTFGLLAMSGMPTAVSLAAFAAAVYRRRILPRFTAHLAAAAAAAHLLFLASFIAHDGPLSLEGFSITGFPALLWAWILATALSMPREASSGRH